MTVRPDQFSQLETDGYIVLPRILSADECDRWNQMIDDIWQREHLKPHTYDDEPGVRFVENLLQHSPMFQRCTTDSVVVAAVRSALGPDVVLSLCNSRCTDPGYGNQPLHELNRQRGKPFLKCDAIWCMDEFTADNGTRVLPGSHLADEEFLSTMEDPEKPHPREVIVAAPRGSVLIFHASLIHAGSTNHGSGPRRSIQTQFVAAGQKVRFDWSVELPDEIKARLEPEGRVLLGLDAASAAASKA